MPADSTFDSWGQIHVENSLVRSTFADTRSALSDSGVNERLMSECSSVTLEVCWHHVKAL